jgi:hypothetical protein
MVTLLLWLGSVMRREPELAPLSVEPLRAPVDLLMKRAVPTLRFY